MKRFCLLLVLAILALALGCEKLQSPASPNAQDNQQESLSQDRRALAEAKAKFEAASAKWREVIAQRQARRLSKAGAQSAAAERTIIVPDDYPTIQAAVDAAAPGDVIKVKPGTYTEFILVDVEQIKISAIDHVVIKGGLIVIANGVMIDHFNIEPLPNTIFFNVALGVVVFGPSSVVAEVEIRGNIISGGDLGIGLLNTRNCLVKSNQLSGAATIGGIALQDADNHTFEENRSTGNLAGINFFSGCDNNRVQANNFNSNVAGIALQGGAGNLFSGNHCSDNGFFGIVVVTGSHNTIGPDNIGNNNRIDGLLLEAGAVYNVVKENTFLHNAGFDINNLGVGNEFFENKAEKTSGV